MRDWPKVFPSPRLASGRCVVEEKVVLELKSVREVEVEKKQS